MNNTMDDELRSESPNEELRICTPSHPLPLEIQQMEQEETTCRYCGVSYLILHEFQRLQQRLREVERELERERGSREQLQSSRDQVDQLRAANQLYSDRVKALTLQVSQADSELVDLRTERTRTRVELDSELQHNLQLRRVCERQRALLREAGPVLRGAAAVLRDVKQELSLLSRDWDTNTALILQHCATACTALKEEVQRLQGELRKSQSEVQSLRDLSRDLREKEASLSSCQQRCESLQQQLLMWKRKEAETRRELEGALREGQRIRDERVALKDLQRDEMLKTERAFRKRLEEERSKWRRDAALELDIERQKNEQLIHKYRGLQDKLPTLVQSAVEELKEEVTSLEERLREREEELKEEVTSLEERLREREEELKSLEEHLREREEELKEEVTSLKERLREREEELKHMRNQALEKEERLLREQQAEVTQLRHKLQERQQEALELQRAHRDVQELRMENSRLHEENCQLQETVRRECEERAELTAALSLAREQLLGVRQAAMSSSISHRSASSSLPSLSAGHGRDAVPGGRSTASWHENTRQLLPALPRLTAERPAPLTETRHCISRKVKHSC